MILENDHLKILRLGIGCSIEVTITTRSHESEVILHRHLFSPSKESHIPSSVYKEGNSYSSILSKKGKWSRKIRIRWLGKERMEVSSALAHVHAISSLAWYWRDSRVGPLERGRMQLCTTPALKGAPFMAVSFMLPSDPPDRLQLQW